MNMEKDQFLTLCTNHCSGTSETQVSEILCFFLDIFLKLIKDPRKKINCCLIDKHIFAKDSPKINIYLPIHTSTLTDCNLLFPEDK